MATAILPTYAHDPHSDDLEVAPFVVLRAAALPFEAIDALRLRRCEILVRQRLDAEEAAEEARPALEEVLHGLVPELEDDMELRRRVVNLRRDVHNGRSPKGGDPVLDTIGARLSPSGLAALTAWRAARTAMAAADAALAEQLPEERQTVLRPALRRPLGDLNFRRALELANPGLVGVATTEKKLPTTPWPDSRERALLGYMARAAAKTSPFSSFMSLSVVPVDPGAVTAWPAASRPGYSRHANLNRGVVARLDRAGLLEALRAGDRQLTVNPTLRPGERGRMFGLCNREIILIGRPWHEQRWAQFRLGDALTSALVAGAEDNWTGWQGRLAEAGIAPASIEASLVKLVERGLLIAAPLSDAFEPLPLDGLAASWQASASPVLTALAPELVALSNLVQTAGTSCGAERMAAVQGVRSAETTLLRDVGAPQLGADDMFQNHILEDCWLTGVEGSFGSNLSEPLADLGDFLSTQVIVSPFYTRLRSAFVESFGRAGVCDDVVAFLLKAAERLIDIPEFGARMAGTEIEHAPAGVVIPVTAHLQLAAGPNRPSPVLVANRVFDGAGWLAARFTAGDEPAQHLLADRLKSWLEALSGGREPVDVVLGGHCSDLQAHAPVTRRVLRWPGEPMMLAPERIIEAADLRLTHDSATDLLEVTDGAGIPLSLFYLGATFPSPIWGVRYALSILTQPYLISRPDLPPPPARAMDAITFEPALTHGDIILRRPTWWVSTRYLFEHWLSGSESERLLKVARDCDRWGVPACVFAQRYIAPDRTSLLPGNVLDANRKPIWIDLRNPFWLAMLERLAKEGDWVSLTEPLPGPDDLWLKIDGKPHVCELHVEMTVRSRPRESASPTSRSS